MPSRESLPFNNGARLEELIIQLRESERRRAQFDLNQAAVYEPPPIEPTEMPTTPRLRTTRFSNWRAGYQEFINYIETNPSLLPKGLHPLIGYMQHGNWASIPFHAYITCLQTTPELWSQPESTIWTSLSRKLQRCQSRRSITAMCNALSKIFPGKIFKQGYNYVAPSEFFIGYRNEEDNLIFKPEHQLQQYEIKVIWNPDKKDWYSDSSMYRLFTKNSKGKSHQKGWILPEKSTKVTLSQRLADSFLADPGGLRSPLSNAQTRLYTFCKCCNRLWIKKHIKYIEKLEKEACPICWSDTKPIYNKALKPTQMVTSYHSHQQQTVKWNYFINRESKKDTGLPMGVELEMHLKSNSTATRNKDLWTIYKQSTILVPTLKDQFYFEEDGSLGGAGVEMITNPMTTTVHQKFWTALLPIIREYFAGWYTNKFGGGSNHYGIHITVNTKYWRQISIARLAAFISAIQNYNFIMALAQRNMMYKGYMPGTGYGKIGETLTFKKEKTLTSRARNQPVNLKGNGLMELRMFASTLNTGSFLKNLEFVAAFHQWSQTTTYNINHIEFIKWLNQQDDKLYPNLIKYLNGKKYAVKGLGIIRTTWADIIKPAPLEQLELLPPNVNLVTTIKDEDMNDVFNHKD